MDHTETNGRRTWHAAVLVAVLGAAFLLGAFLSSAGYLAYAIIGAMFLGIAVLIGRHVRFSLTLMFLITALIAELLAVWRLTPTEGDPDVRRWQLIEVGMSEKEVEEIMGRRGSRVGLDEWDYAHGITVEFRNGHVTKAYRSPVRY
jgi:hypothetical protein